MVDSGKATRKQADEVVKEIKKIADNIIKKTPEQMWKEFEYKHFFEVPPKKPCFLAGTLVKTEKGSKPIEQIQIGEMVYAFNFETKKVELKPVTELFVNSCDKYLEIHTASDVIKATGAHRFWIPAKNKWIKARELTVGMNFQDINGKNIEIFDLKIIDQIEKTYNFEVADLHNYYVGIDQVLSHNKSIKDSIFASTDIIEVNFYQIADSKKEAMYVGQTVQKVGARFDQHKRDPKKASWVDKMDGVFEIRLNGEKGPFKMTPYEAAVTELYEINNNKATTKSVEAFKNKSKPIGEKKFDYFKKHGNFNPCIFYA